jgi:hypothetical protein
MSRGERSFGALVAHDGVTLVEFETERTGIRVANQWSDNGRSTTIDEALNRLTALISTLGIRRGRLSVAIEQFGVVHHVMVLPPAADEVLRPVVKREVQRVFGVPDPVVAFSRGAAQERREPARADEKTAPRQLFVAGAPSSTVDALASRLAMKGWTIEIATVVPKAMHALYEMSGAPLEPTAVLLCLESGPHLAFFLDGRLELAIDPPIALEGDRPSLAMVLDQVERGAVYFRQQFRGASASRILLAAPADEYEALASELEQRLSARVKPLVVGNASPEAVVAMGAVLEAQSASPLDLFPHPPTAGERIATAVRGPNAVLLGAAAAAIIAVLWGASQYRTLTSARRENERLRQTVAEAIPALGPMRQTAERRAGVMRQIDFVRRGLDERSALSRSLTGVASSLPDGVVFDSLSVTRAADAWDVHIAGVSHGMSAAQAVGGLQAFLQGLRTRPSISGTTLNNFDYVNGDSLAPSNSVQIQFHLTFNVKRAEGTP